MDIRRTAVISIEMDERWEKLFIKSAKCHLIVVHACIMMGSRMDAQEVLVMSFSCCVNKKVSFVLSKVFFLVKFHLEIKAQSLF